MSNIVSSAFLNWVFASGKVGKSEAVSTFPEALRLRPYDPLL